MIVGRNLAKRFGKNGLAPIDITLKDGEFLGLSGASGCGKTTLLNILSGMLRPDSGTVSINGQELEGLSPRKKTALRAGTIGYMMQGSVLLPELTVLQNILLPSSAAGRPCDIEQAKMLCNRLGISSILHSYPNEISGGEYRRVMLARILLAEPPVLFADEPTSNLDAESAAIVRDMLREVHERGTSILAATHDKELLGIADTVLVIHSA